MLVHKVVLSMGSKYFEAMFNNNGLLENEKKMVTYEDVEAPFVRLMLDFIYLNEIELNDDNIQEIANLSSRFQIMDLAEQCADFMHRRLRVDNCIGVMRFADLLAFTNLRLAAKRFVESNFAEIIKEEEFLDLPFYMLKSFIKSEDLSIDSEDQVLEATLRWIAHEAAVPRLKHLDEFLDLIRMPLINVSVLTKFMAHYVEHPKIVDALQRFVLINQQKLANGCHGSDECLSGYEMVRNQPRMAARRSIFMIGGASVNRYSRHPSQISNVVEKFDLHSYEWIEMASMKIPRYSHSAVVLDRKIYVIGGNADSLILDSVEVYCPKRDEWRLGAQLKKPRTNLGACVFDGRIYVFGGLSCRPHRSIEVLDPDQGPQWHYYDNLPMRMYSMKAIEHKRYIYIIGGCDENKQALDTVFRYNPIKKEFTAMARMNQPRFLFGCVAIHNLIYVFGGLDENNERLSSAEQYNIKEVRFVLMFTICLTSLFFVLRTRGRSSPRCRTMSSVRVRSPATT